MRAPKREATHTEKATQRASLNRHRAQCSICAHEECAEIEAAFVAWENTEKIAADFNLPHRTTIYRHVRFFGLDAKRQRNIRVPLQKIIERAGVTCPLKTSPTET